MIKALKELWRNLPDPVVATVLVGGAVFALICLALLAVVAFEAAGAKSILGWAIVSAIVGLCAGFICWVEN